MQTIPLKTINNTVDVAVNWPKPSKFGSPLYYHLRYGPVTKQLMFPAESSPPFLSQHGGLHRQNKNLRSQRLSSFQMSRIKREPSSSISTRIGSNEFDESRFISLALSDLSELSSKPNMPGLWVIIRAEAQEVKSDAVNHTTILLRNLPLGQNFGVQVLRQRLLYTLQLGLPTAGFRPETTHGTGI